MSLQTVESPPGIAPVGPSNVSTACRPGSNASKESQALEASCSPEVLLEVRWLAHQLQGSSEEQSGDHAAWLLLGLLGHISSFNSALATLQPHARHRVMPHLRIKRFPPDKLLTWSDLDTEVGGIAAGLVMKGSLQLLGAAPGQELELPAGGEIPSCRAACGSQGAELLIMLRKSLDEAALREKEQEALRLDAREVLKKTERMSRGISDLEVLRRYLDTLPLFQHLPDEKLLRLCQHLQLLPTVHQGECLLQQGEHVPASGLRLLLRGTAAASVGSDKEPPLPLWCHQAWFCEDDAIWPWELVVDGQRVADVVAIQDCDVVFLPRAECRFLPIGTDMVRSCFSQILSLKSRGPDQAVLPRRALLVPDSPLIQAQEEYWTQGLRMDHHDSKQRLQQLVSTPSLVPQRLLMQENEAHEVGPGSSSPSINPGSSSSFRSGIEVGNLMRIPSYELEEECLGLHQSYAYGAILDWAEGITRCLLPGIHGELRPAWQLLPRGKRQQLGPHAQLLQLYPGQLLRQAPGDREGIKVVLSGMLGHFEACKGVHLHSALLKALPTAVERHFLSKGIAITEQAKEWLEDLTSDHADAEDPVEVGAMSGLAEALLQVAQRRFWDLNCPGEGVRSSVSSVFLDRKLLGDEAPWVEKDLELLAQRRSRSGDSALETSSPEVYVDISEIGEMKQLYGPGERLSADKMDFVALKSTDVLIVDPSALLADMEESVVIPSVEIRSKDARNAFSIKELFRLAKLLRRTEAFQQLDCRALVDVCHVALHFETLDRGRQICREGQEATGFFLILAGTASSSSKGAFLFQLTEGSAVGEDVLEQEMIWPFSVTAETAVEILWIDAKLFREVCLDLSGERAARRKILEVADWRLEDRTEDLEAFLQRLKVPLLQDYDRELCFELLKQATILHIPAGGLVVEMLEGDCVPLHVILKGAVGCYAMDLPEEATEEAGDSVVPTEHLEDAEEIASKRRRLAKATEDLEDLKSRHRGLTPLDRSVQETLKVHFLTKLVTELSAELQALPEVELPDRRGETHREPKDDHSGAADAKAAQSTGFFLTSPVDNELPDEVDEFEDSIDKALMECYEGDSFGWDAASNAHRYVVHQDASLLLLRHEDLLHAQEICETRRRQHRGQFLHRCLGDEDVAMRLLPLFKEERCHKGTVLVKAGSAPSTNLWLILSGSCSQVKEESKEIRGRFQRSSLGMLQEGQFVGLTSLLLQQPEPLTVICATEVQLLRAENLSPAKLTPKVIEVLKSALHQKGAWLCQRLETLAELPAKLDAKAERLRSELYEARVPLVSDSPFLRRKDQALLPGMVALEAVCKHFGKEVHPESEWIYMQKDRDFFMHMQLSSGFSEPFPKAEAPEHGAKNLGFITSSATANARFVHHQPLLWKKLRMDEPTEVVSPKPSKTPTSKELVVPQGPAQGPEPVSEVCDLEMPPPKAESPRNVEAALEEQLRRKPHVVLRSNSRVFQNCSTEVTMNERRAIKEAKSKVLLGGVVREPLVTPRDQGQSRSIAKRHWQKGFALASQSLQKGAAAAAAATGAAATPKAVPSPPQRKSGSSAEESFASGAMQFARPRQVDSTKHRKRVLTSQRSSCRSNSEEITLSIDGCMLHHLRNCDESRDQ